MPTSADLLNTHFEKANFGGYKTADVESFVEDVKTYISKTSKETAELKRQLSEAQKKASLYTAQEESIKKTLLSAQVLADKITKEANDKAEEILNNAKETAESKTRSAKIKVENLIDCAQSEVDMRKKEAATIKAEVYNFKLSLMRLYRAQLELINEIPAEEPKEDIKEADETSKEPEESKKEVKTEDGDTTGEEKINEPDEPIKEEPKPENSEEAEKEAAVTAAPEPSKTEENDLPFAEAEVSKEEEKPSFAAEEKEQKQKKEEPAAAAPGTVKLNLRYNERTGEYEPLNKVHNNDEDEPAGLFNLNEGKNGDGLKFGADYNIRTDSFDRKD